MTEPTNAEVIQKIESLSERFNDYISNHSNEHQDLWKHVNGTKTSINGEGKYTGIRTDVELLKQAVASIIEQEKSRRHREWSIISGMLFLVAVEIFERIPSGLIG